MLKKIRHLAVTLFFLTTMWGILHLLFRPKRTPAFIIGHRGAKGLAPENTLAAIQASIEQGVSFIEIDVQRTADGQLVVFHDLLLDRTTNGLGAISSRAWEDVRKLDAGSHFNSQFAGEPIPFLEEVFTLLQEQPITLIIEMKEPTMFHNIEQDLIAMIRRFEAESRVVVISFDHQWLAGFHQLAPMVPLGTLWRYPPFNMIVPSYGVVDVDWRLVLLDPTFVRRMRQQGNQVWVYTVNDPRLMQLLAWLGVNGITTDRPDVGIKYFKV